ncbi:DUF4905 domain-containing protein [bacterium]|nr:DUF4905 domain-containing protein [bacterium]
MRLFSTSRQRWKPAWTYDAGAHVWRFVFTGDGRLLGEARDTDARTTTFFCLREADGSVVFEKLRSDEEWWVGFEAVEGSRFYLHGFRKPDMPQHLGIRAHDLDTGALLWRNDDLAFVLARGDAVYATREGFGGLEFFRLSPEDGSVIEDMGQDTESINVLRALLNEEEDFRGYRYPEPMTAAHPGSEDARKTLQKLVDPSRVIGTLDALVEDNLLLAAWHEAKAPSKGAADNGSDAALRQQFRAVSLDGKQTLFEDIILDHADAPGMDSFFLKDSQLMYIKNRRILTAHDLNGVPS